MVEDTSKFVEDTTKRTTEITSNKPSNPSLSTIHTIIVSSQNADKLVEEGVVVAIPDYFKLDTLQEKLSDDDEDDDDEDDSSSDEDENHCRHGHKSRAAKNVISAPSFPPLDDRRSSMSLVSEDRPSTPPIKVYIP